MRKGRLPPFSTIGQGKYSLQEQNIEKKNGPFVKHPIFFLTMLLILHLKKNSILRGLGIIISTLLSIYDLEGF